MATNILFGDCEIPLAGTASLVTVTAATGFELPYLFGGNKSDRFKLSATAAAGEVRFKTDLGSGVTKAVDFLYVGNLNLLKVANVSTIVVKGNSTDDYSTATTAITISSVSSQTAMGPGDDDYLVFQSSASSAFRYWWVNYTVTGTGSKLPHSKIFFGRSFDPGFDAEPGIEITRKRPTGARRRAAFIVSLSWRRITYAKAAEMYERFAVLQRAKPVVLFTNDYHSVFYDHKVLFGRITSFSAPPVLTDQNDIEITFEENI